MRRTRRVVLLIGAMCVWGLCLGTQAERDAMTSEELLPFGPALEPAVAFQIGAPLYMHSGKFNGDGNLDLLLLTLSSGDDWRRPFTFRVVLLFGDGTGQFHSPQVLHEVEEVQREGELAWRGLGGFTVGDFDQDGYFDIAISDSVHGRLWLFWGDGAGQFSRTSLENAVEGFAPSAVVSADLTASGYSDLAVLDPLAGLIYVFSRLRGPREFTPSAQVPLPHEYLPLSLHRGRLTDHALDDLVVLAYRMSAQPGQLVILGVSLSSGEPRLYSNIFVGYPAPVETPAWDIGDYDGDGHLDILLVRHGMVFALWGDDRGGFTVTDLYPSLDPLVLHLLLVDVDQDGCLNLVLVGQGTQRVWVSRGCYVDEHYMIPIMFRRAPRCGVVADVNGDGLPDLVVATALADWTHLEVFLGRR